MNARLIALLVVVLGALMLPTSALRAQAERRAVDSLIVNRLAFVGRSMVYGANQDSIQLEVRVENHADSAIAVQFGACTMTPRLAQAVPGENLNFLPPPSGIIRYRRRDGSLGEIVQACPLYRVEGSIPPGETLEAREFAWRGPIRQLASDVGPGRYRVVALVQLFGTIFTVPAGDVTVPRTRRGSEPPCSLTYSTADKGFTECALRAQIIGRPCS